MISTYPGNPTLKFHTLVRPLLLRNKKKHLQELIKIIEKYFIIFKYEMGI